MTKKSDIIKILAASFAEWSDFTLFSSFRGQKTFQAIIIFREYDKLLNFEFLKYREVIKEIN